MPRLRRINATERRAARRVPASDVVPQAVTRLATGQQVKLVNIALNGGILIHSRSVLSPGSFVRLRLNIPGVAMNMEGRVQRCRVVGLKQEKIQYEAAILLEGGLPEPLAKILQQLDETNQSEERCTQEIDADALELPETAQLWVLNSQGAEMPA